MKRLSPIEYQRAQFLAHQHAYARPGFELPRIANLKRHVMAIIGPINRQWDQRKGDLVTVERAESAVRAVLPASMARYVHVEGAISKKRSHSKQRTLQLTVPHPMFNQELNAHRSALQTVVESLGFAKFSVRVG